MFEIVLYWQSGMSATGVELPDIFVPTLPPVGSDIVLGRGHSYLTLKVERVQLNAEEVRAGFYEVFVSVA